MRRDAMGASLGKTQSRWYGAWVLAGLAAVMTPPLLLAASGGSGGFDSVVQGIETRYHVHANKIPFMSLVSGIAAWQTHGSVHNLHVAEFENFKGDRAEGKVDGDEFLKLVESRAGEGWSRMIRETNRSGNEQTVIFVRGEGKQIGMLVVDMSGRELDVVQISMNPDQLMKQLKEHDHHLENDGDAKATDKPVSNKDDDEDDQKSE